MWRRIVVLLPRALSRAQTSKRQQWLFHIARRFDLRSVLPALSDVDRFLTGAALIEGRGSD